MSNKKVIEGKLCDFIGRYWYLSAGEEQYYFDSTGDEFDKNFIFNGLEGKRVRITIEEID